MNTKLITIISPVRDNKLYVTGEPCAPAVLGMHINCSLQSELEGAIERNVESFGMPSKGIEIRVVHGLPASQESVKIFDDDTVYKNKVFDGETKTGAQINKYIEDVIDLFVKFYTSGVREHQHGPGCWNHGPSHYKCALAEIERLNQEREA